MVVVSSRCDIGVRGICGGGSKYSASSTVVVVVIVVVLEAELVVVIVSSSRWSGCSSSCSSVGCKLVYRKFGRLGNRASPSSSVGRALDF